MNAGARMLAGLVGDIAIPRQTGGGTAYWVAESNAPDAESNQTFDQVPLSPKTLGASVITTQAEINDATAYQTGALLARALAEGKGVIEAFEESKPGQGRNYLLFHDMLRSEATETRTVLMLNEWGSRLSSKIDGLERRLDREIGAMRQELSDLAGNVQAAVKLPPWHRSAFVAAFGLLFLPVPLFYVQVRDWLDIGWQAALSLAFFAYLFSAVLWSYMWWGGRGST